MKKRFLSLVMVLTMVLSIMPFSAITAFSSVEGDWLYTLHDEDTTAAITGYTGTDPSIIIPSTIAGKPVTRIGGNAFEDKASLTSVIIPDSVLRIENRAFTNSGLTSVDLGEGVEYIGQYAFNGTELASLSIPNSVEIIDIAAFALCDKLSSISIIGNNLSTLGDGAFSGTAITSFRIPTSLSIIEDNTFKDCASLSSIQIPSNITSIDYYAFGGCSSLVSSTFEGNAPAMGNFVFSNSHADFKIYYYTGSTGFNTPTWTTGLVTYNTVVLDPLPDYVCEIGSMQYESFTSALAAAVDGDTITMLKNIEHNNHIYIVNKNLTLDLNGFTFTLNNPVGDGLWVDHGSWNLTGEGEFNVTARYYPVYAYNGGSITVTNVSNNEDGGWPAASANGTGSNVTVLEDSVANGTGGKAVYSSDNANIIVWGDATATGHGGQAVHAPNGNVIVHGDTLTSGSDSFSNYATNGGSILIKGNAEATGYGTYTLYSDGENSSIEVLGNVTGTAIGVYSRNSASALIHGNITAAAGYGIVIETSGNANVLGDVTATGGAGVSVSVGTATIEGTITAYDYIVLFGVIKTANDYIEPTTKLGYLTYSYEDATYGTSTVWIAADLPVATNVAINGSAIVGETLTGEYDFNGTTESGSTFRWLADTGTEYEVFNTMNIAGVNNNPTVPAEFVLSETTVISKILNYHWNNSYGAVPGTIALQEAGGTIYGPWDAEGKYGNLYWEVTPFVELPAGTYTIIDSSSETWANNYESGYRGMTVVSAANYSNNYIPIVNAVDQTYLLTSEDVGNRIKFEATVKDSGGLTGTPVTSSAIGPVSLPISIEVLFSGGTGTALDPYLISSEADLIALAQKVSGGESFSGKYFKQTHDIELTQTWVPIGWIGSYYDTNIPFNGHYDGQNKSISNLNIASGISWAGLFAVVGNNGVIDSVELQNASISGGNFVGALVGELRGVIRNCNVDGVVTGNFATGGLAGQTYDGLVEDCHSTATVTGTGEFAGGIIGYAFSSYGSTEITITQSSSSGNVNGYNKTGGLIGGIQGGRCVKSFSTGTVSGAYRYTGGLIGVIDSANGFIASVEDCYTNASVIAPNTSYVGGLAGANWYGTIRNSYAAGTIDSEGVIDAGGLTGSIYSGAVALDSYYDSERCGLSDTGKGIPKTTAEMKDQTTFSTWSFPDDWTLSSDNNGYPALAWQGYSHETLSDDATLSSLTASSITLTPIFDSSLTSYSASVANDIRNTTITAAASDSGATLEINSLESTSLEVTLNVGENIITVKVTAEDGISIQTYTITISRASTGSSGSSGSSDYTPPAIIVVTEELNSSTTNSTSVPSSNVSGTTSATVTTAIVDALLNKIDSDGGSEKNDLIQLDIDTKAGTNELNVSILQKDFEEISEQTDAHLSIASPFISITFDAKALETISAAESGGTVVISAGVIDNSALSVADQLKVQDRPVYDLTVTNGDTKVSDFSGGYATVTIPYILLPDENPNAIVVYYLGDDGTLKMVNGHYDAASESVVFKTAHFSNFVIGYNTVVFSDVKNDVWYKNAVDFIAARGITSGIGENKYGPEANLTRAQFVVLLMNAYQIKTLNHGDLSQIQNFSDAGDTYYTNYLKTAKSLGIVNGIGNNLFAPEKEISRQEMFVMLHNALKLIDEVPEAVISKPLSSFNDANQIDGWASEALTNLVNAGIVTGSNNKLNPAHNTTRAEIAQVLYNLFVK